MLPKQSFPSAAAHFLSAPTSTSCTSCLFRTGACGSHHVVHGTCNDNAGTPKHSEQQNCSPDLCGAQAWYQLLTTRPAPRRTLCKWKLARAAITSLATSVPPRNSTPAPSLRRSAWISLRASKLLQQLAGEDKQLSRLLIPSNQTLSLNLLFYQLFHESMQSIRNFDRAFC